MPEGGFARPFAGLWHGSRATAKRPEDVVASRRGLIPTDDVKSLQIPLFFLSFCSSIDVLHLFIVLVPYGEPC